MLWSNNLSLKVLEYRSRGCGFKSTRWFYFDYLFYFCHLFLFLSSIFTFIIYFTFVVALYRDSLTVSVRGGHEVYVFVGYILNYHES